MLAHERELRKEINDLPYDDDFADGYYISPNDDYWYRAQVENEWAELNYHSRDTWKLKGKRYTQRKIRGYARSFRGWSPDQIVEKFFWLTQSQRNTLIIYLRLNGKSDEITAPITSEDYARELSKLEGKAITSAAWRQRLSRTLYALKWELK